MTAAGQAQFRNDSSAPGAPASKRGVRAWSGTIVFPTYLPAAPDKNPMFLEKRVYQGSSGKVYPLPFTDRIAEKPVDRKWKAVWIENEFLRALVLPELGGRIHTLQDKTNGYDLIYNQPVIKPALVGLAGPWASGGIEFNWPQHHRPAMFLPVDFESEKHAGGSQTIWCSDHDPMTRMKGLHGVCLHPGRAYLELKVRAYNRTPFTQTFLWWANVATRVHEAYQSFFPPDVSYVADHARRSMSEYPLAKGFYYGVNYGERGRKGIPASEVPGQFVPPPVPSKLNVQCSMFNVPNYSPNDLSFYANIPVPTSYMCMGSQEDFFGGYDHAAQAGIVHIANHHISPGKKQWTWGNHDFGYAWDRNLTDAVVAQASRLCDSGQPTAGRLTGETPVPLFPPHIEIMSGVYTDNQPDFSFLQPGETKTWSQFWYPIQKIGAAQHVNLDAAISLRVLDCGAKRGATPLSFGLSVTKELTRAKILLAVGGKKLFSTTRDLAPGKPFVKEIKLPRGVAETDLLLRVTDSSGNEIVSYQPKPREKTKVPPPATEPPAPADIASADELFITGLHLEQYRHATRCPTLYWREALRRDPGDSRCNNAIGAWHLKRGEFTLAETHFRRAIERLTRRNANPADGEAYYNLGLCLRFQNRDDEAYGAFYKACWNQAWMAAGYHALAEIDCGRKNFATALEHLNRSLRFDTDNLRARNLKVIVLRKLKREDEATALLRETLALDLLDWWARHLRGEKMKCDSQTALDIAHDFARAGLFSEAIELLACIALHKSGALPLLHYTLGWLHERLEGTRASDRFNAPISKGHRSGVNAALRCFREGAALSPDYCFPSRLEEIVILEAAMRANPHDGKAPYYLGNLLYDRRRHDEAIVLWEKSAKLDGNFSIVWRNLGIGYFNIRQQPAKARAAYDRAFKANPTDARLLYERDRFGNGWAKNPRAVCVSWRNSPRSFSNATI